MDEMTREKLISLADKWRKEALELNNMFKEPHAHGIQRQIEYDGRTTSLISCCKELVEFIEESDK